MCRPEKDSPLADGKLPQSVIKAFGKHTRKAHHQRTFGSVQMKKTLGFHGLCSHLLECFSLSLDMLVHCCPWAGTN